MSDVGGIEWTGDNAAKLRALAGRCGLGSHVRGDVFVLDPPQGGRGLVGIGDRVEPIPGLGACIRRREGRQWWLVRPVGEVPDAW